MAGDLSLRRNLIQAREPDHRGTRLIRVIRIRPNPLHRRVSGSHGAVPDRAGRRHDTAATLRTMKPEEQGGYQRGGRDRPWKNRPGEPPRSGGNTTPPAGPIATPGPDRRLLLDPPQHAGIEEVSRGRLLLGGEAGTHRLAEPAQGLGLGTEFVIGLEQALDLGTLSFTKFTVNEAVEKGFLI